jgi:hypothetical protein
MDIIAPQDGRGTGKGALFWPYEKDKLVSSVDPELSKYSNVGTTASFAQAYNASTRELYLASQQSIDAANANGAHTVLWANFEAFEPTASEACSYASNGRTTKPRLDRAIMMGAGAVRHIVSYMYDPLFTCTTPNHPKALIDEILDDSSRPIVDTAFRFTSNGKDGFIVRGFHIAELNPKLSLTYYDSSWAAHTVVLTPDWTNPIWGQTNSGPAHTQELFLPFSFDDLAPNFWVHVRAQNDAGVASEAFSYGY